MTDKDKQKQLEKEIDFLDQLVKQNSTTNAMQKLDRKPLKVSVYRHTPFVQQLEEELSLIEESLKKDTKDSIKEKLNNRKLAVEKKLKEAENDKIEGQLTFLTYRDINDVKAAVTEAAMHFEEYNFDPGVKLSRIVAEERYMTVFCALKCTDNDKKRYFKSLEDIAQIDDVTIFDIYEKWEKHFVLTEEELKN